MKHMRSRTVFYHGILLLIAAVLSLAPPRAAAAEKLIGVIMTGNVPYYREIQKTFAQTLQAGGIDPDTAQVVVQSPAPEPMSWTNAARKLVAIGSDVIVSYGAPATIAVLNETSDIPVVFAGVFDPQAVGIAGSNVTGISSKIPLTSLVKNFKSIDNFQKLGVVFNASEKDTVIQAREIEGLESSFGFHSVRFDIRRAEDTRKISNVDALFLTTSCAAMHCVDNIMAIARREKIPTASTMGGEEDQGVILTIAANPYEQGREAARLAARLMKGAKPSSIPMESPKKVDMIVNLKEAMNMGLKVPFDLLTSATKVIK
ncbi:MAG: ABC transporter substrate-binding protein [Candidatus Sulfobium sp.]